MQDFKEHLRRQLGFLDRSAAAFDAGYQDEGIRIAGALRVIFHDKGRQVSLLTRLAGWKARLNSSAEDISPSVQWTNQLSGLGPEGIIPRLDAFFPMSVQPAAAWWSQQEVIVHPDSGRLTRADIALNACDKDGYAHVDEKLTPEYRALMTFWQYGHGDGPWQVEPTHLVALRQMAFEILNSPEIASLAE